MGLSHAAVPVMRLMPGDISDHAAVPDIRDSRMI